MQTYKTRLQNVTDTGEWTGLVVRRALDIIMLVESGQLPKVAGLQMITELLKESSSYNSSFEQNKKIEINSILSDLTIKMSENI